MRYCLDTNVVIDIMKGDSAIKEKIENLVNIQANFCINPIILCELFKGVFLTKQLQREAFLFLEDFSLNTEFLDFREDICRLVGDKHAELIKKGKPTQDMDLMIGCIALAHDATLITRNPKDFVNISGLKVISV